MMSYLLANAEQLLIDSIVKGNTPFTGRNKAGAGLMILSGLMLAAGLGFIIYASYLWLNAHYLPDMAAALTGALALFMAVLSALMAHAYSEYKRLRLRKIKAEATQTLQNAFDMLNAELEHPIRENPKTSVLIASLAGFMVGEKIL
jgi:hypothetical protein